MPVVMREPIAVELLRTAAHASTDVAIAHCAWAKNAGMTPEEVAHSVGGVGECLTRRLPRKEVDWDVAVKAVRLAWLAMRAGRAP